MANSIMKPLQIFSNFQIFLTIFGFPDFPDFRAKAKKKKMTEILEKNICLSSSLNKTIHNEIYKTLHSAVFTLFLVLESLQNS